MGRLDFFKTIYGLPPEERFEQFMRYRLAPVTSGAKPAELITLCSGGYGLFELWTPYGDELMGRLGLEYRYLRKGDSCSCVLVYDRSALSKVLSGRQARGMLRSRGYPDGFELEGAIEGLRARFSLGCPHEIGLFLGIPFGDVMGFLRNRGTSSIAQGYWKVYSRPARAERLFSLYDEAKERVIQDFIERRA